MEVYKYKDMKGGWFIGNFEPTIVKTKDFEVAYNNHPKGQNWPAHYHKKGTEITLLIRGKMEIQDIILNSGDIFVLKPYEIANPIFLEDCEVMIIKIPSVPGDKFNIK